MKETKWIQAKNGEFPDAELGIQVKQQDDKKINSYKERRNGWNETNRVCVLFCYGTFDFKIGVGNVE